MVYHQIPHLGAVYAEVQQTQAGKKWFEIDHEDGETFVWIGRFHIILTPWRRLVTYGAALWTFLVSPGQIIALNSMKTAAASLIVFTASATSETSTPVVEAHALPPSWEALLEWDANQHSLEASVRVARVTLSTSQ